MVITDGSVPYLKLEGWAGAGSSGFRFDGDLGWLWGSCGVFWMLCGCRVGY